MTDKDYQSIISNCFIHHNEFMEDYICRQYELATDQGIGFKEFFYRLDQVIGCLKKDIEYQFNNRKAQLRLYVEEAERQKDTERIAQFCKEIAALDIENYTTKLISKLEDGHTVRISDEDISEIRKAMDSAYIKYLPKNNIKVKPTLNQKQIALKHVYEGNPITRENGQEIANNYDYISPRSGDKIYQHYLKYCRPVDRFGDPGSKRLLVEKIKLFESVTDIVEPEFRTRIQEEIEMMKSLLFTHYT